MKQAILIFVLVTCTLGKAQVPTFDNRQQYLDYVFNNISQTNTPSGFLLNRNLILNDSIVQRYINGPNGLPIHKIDDWFQLYQILSHAKTDVSNIDSVDKVMWPLYDKLQIELELEEYVTLPIMILDYEAQKIKDDAIIEGNVIYHNEQYFEGINSSEGFESVHLYTACLLLDTLRNPNVKVVFDQSYLLSNRGKIPDYCVIELNENIVDTLYFNDEFDLKNNLFEYNEMKIILHYNDGEKITSYFSFHAFIPAQNRTIAENLFFDENGTIGINPVLKYSVKFGCNHTDFVKPIIFVSGFNLASNNAILTLLAQTDNAKLYDKFNLDGMMDELLASGHDIVIVRFVPAVADLVAAANHLITLINSINQRKTNNNSNIENILIGYSAGAMCLRYALDKMEYEHMINNGPHHHSKLYVSFEGEHQGANVPIGPQVMLQYMHDNHDGVLINTIHYMANSPQAKQLMKFYWAQTVSTGSPTDDIGGQGPDPLRTSFMFDMEELYVHSKQVEKFGYHGYPAFARNVSVVNGSYKTGSFDGIRTVNEPFNFDLGHTLFEDFDSDKYYWLVKFNSNANIDDNGGANRVVFYYKEKIGLGANYYYSIFKTNNTLLMYDYCPGGFLEGGDDILKKVMDKVHDKLSNNVAQTYEYRTTSFTPVISCLDIRNFTPTNFQLHWDLQSNELLYYGFDEITGIELQSDFFGYPWIGHPTNHFAITPFEAIYADEFNETHIGSFSTSAVNGAYPSASTLSNAPHDFINDFLFTEIMYKKLYLQNREIGWNTDGSDYTAEFETQDEIIIGEAVTYQTDPAPFNVLSNGTVICHAANSISIKPGFHAQAGSGFHAYIEEPTCTTTGGGPSAMALQGDDNLAQKNNSNEIAANITEQKSNQTLKIVPNPNAGVFYLDLGDYSGNLYIEIYDLSGKLKFSNWVQAGEQINLSLENGVYLVKANVENMYLQQKLVIQ